MLHGPFHGGKVYNNVRSQEKNFGTVGLFGLRVYVRKVVSTVRELLQKQDVGNIRPRLESHKINLEKQQKQIETLNQEIAELVGADAIEKEILDRCEFEASLQETISFISSRLSFAKESKNSAETTPSINQQEAPIGKKRVAKLNFQNSLCQSSLAIPQNEQHFEIVALKLFRVCL